jgi:GTPase
VDLEALASQLNQLSHNRVYIISAVTRTGLEQMMREIWRILDEINALETEKVAIGV